MRKITADRILDANGDLLPSQILILDEKGKVRDLSSGEGDEATEVFQGIICPGFVNAHCHLELSHLKGRLPEGTGIVDFIREIQQLRTSDPSEIQQAMVWAEEEMMQNGIVAVGDISNSNISFDLKSKQNLAYHTFIELFSFDPNRADTTIQYGKKLLDEYVNLVNNKVSITPHAPYSASERLLNILGINSLEGKNILSVHNQESEAENEFFTNKTGRFKEHFERFNIPFTDWIAPATKSIYYLLKHIGTGQKIQLVHNTFTDKVDVEQAMSSGNEIWFCFCPRANKYIENKLPDFEIFPSDRVTIGTDSLASNHSLSILEEIKLIQSNSLISTGMLLQWATKNGAEFLEFSELGSFEKGKKPGVLLLSNLGDNNKLIPETTVKKLA